MTTKINSQDALVYTALSMLCKSGAYKAFVPEILFVLPKDTLTDFIKVFGGETIRIPTPEKFAEDLQIAVIAYYKVVEAQPDKWIKENFNLDGNKYRKINCRIDKWLAALSAEEKQIFMNIKLANSKE